MGHSKILPQIALGHSQSFILNTAHFENEVLHLAELMLPNLLSSTMNMADLMGKTGQDGNANNQGKTGEQKKHCPLASKDRKEGRTKHHTQLLPPEQPISSVPHRGGRGLEQEGATSMGSQLTFPTPGSLNWMN